MRWDRKLGAVLLALAALGGCERPAKPSAAAPAADTSVTSMTPDAHSSRTALDWSGTYSGVLPCASCPGIETEVTLNGDGSYQLRRYHVDEASAPDVRSGTFSWDASGSRVVLGGADAQRYQVGENVLFHLDRDGARISGDLADRYVLEKHGRDPAIDGRRWRLVELRGRPIDGMELAAEPTLSFAADGSTVSGNASCNSFSAAYALKSGNRIRFARQLAVTLMACPDMSVEAEFLDVLQTADNYAIGSDGTLSLNRARMAPLARFAPVEGPE